MEGRPNKTAWVSQQRHNASYFARTATVLARPTCRKASIARVSSSVRRRTGCRSSRWWVPPIRVTLAFTPRERTSKYGHHFVRSSNRRTSRARSEPRCRYPGSHSRLASSRDPRLAAGLLAGDNSRNQLPRSNPPNERQARPRSLLLSFVPDACGSRTRAAIAACTSLSFAALRLSSD
jgi:hypothetical protein